MPYLPPLVAAIQFCSPQNRRGKGHVFERKVHLRRHNREWALAGFVGDLKFTRWLQEASDAENPDDAE